MSTVDLGVPGGVATLDENGDLPADQQTPNGGWVPLTLLNGWVNFGSGYPVPSYLRLANGEVIFRGVIKDGAVPSVAFNMPAGVGVRPDAPSGGSALSGSGTTVGAIEVDIVGVATISAGSNTFFYLTQLRYLGVL